MEGPRNRCSRRGRIVELQVALAGSAIVEYDELEMGMDSVAELGAVSPRVPLAATGTAVAQDGVGSRAGCGST